MLIKILRKCKNVLYCSIKPNYMAVTNCLKGSLQEYVPSPSKPWNEKRVHHLYNKLSNGAPNSLIKAALNNGPGLVDYLLSSAKSHPLPGEVKTTVTGKIDYTYPWKEQAAADYDPNNSGAILDVFYQKYYYLVQMWLNGMVQEGLRHKLALFWSNHFVTNNTNVPSWNFQYYYLLHKNALGNFKQFVMDIGRTPNMLIYLDGAYSYAINPNENYARELLELFTMGVGNYTEDDVAEVARSMTGWTIEYNYFDTVSKQSVGTYLPNKVGEFKFRGAGNYGHDFGKKNILGKSIPAASPKSGDLADATRIAHIEYQALHDLIFTERKEAIAKFICKKLYKFYMYEFPPDDILNGLAQVFISSNWDIMTVLKTLFKSEHFYEEENMGLNIKSHIDTVIHYYRTASLKNGEDYFLFQIINNARVRDPLNTKNIHPLDNIYFECANLGQNLFNPINVAGWPGYRSWLNEFTLVNRWRFMRSQIDGYLSYPATATRYREFLKEISNNSKDPDFIVRKLIEYFIPVEMPEDIILNAVDSFKSLVPLNYFNDGTWTLDYVDVPRQYTTLMKYIITLPESNLL